MAAFNHIMDILVWSIQIFTGLLIGFSLVGLEARRTSRKLLIISLFFGVAYAAAAILFSPTWLIPILIILALPFLVRLMKVPVAQSTIAVLLAVIYNLAVVSLIEYNIFYLLLDAGNVSLDTGTKMSINLFVSLNNIFIAMIVYSNSPVLFPKLLFEKSLDDDDPEISFSGRAYSVILILFLLAVGLYYTVWELPHIRLHYRWFITLWSLTVTVAIILFQRKLILFKNEKVQLFLDRQYQKELLTFFSMIRSQRHDFNFHLTAIYGLIQKKEYAACETYIKEMVKSATVINDLLPLHHPATAAMLSTFKERAAAKGISIEYIIMNDLRNCPCSVYEINKVLGNLIQNALDEVERLPEKNHPIIVELNTEWNQLMITVMNETDLAGEKLGDLFEAGFSTKVHHEGLGLPAVKKIVEKYQGIVYPELEEGFIHFHVSIPEGTTTKRG
ncbi:sensor histidine kinase [Sporosarcina sp. Te-1]|uniref:sensor histidine kinase n=1 Tax=Sporosarcina sp. Te-1 TaxID=2818390 RepID=UPI001A9D3FFD|nr:GHKL domain-containing protein [Sporosarcina sp. Te-1]QTD40844.1 GHKL domain-containing protein [Sporosarcina sp. Te-1]